MGVVIKGQIKPKANWRVVDSPKKGKDDLGFFCSEKQNGGKNCPLGFGKIYDVPICLFDLKGWNKKSCLLEIAKNLKGKVQNSISGMFGKKPMCLVKICTS